MNSVAGFDRKLSLYAIAGAAALAASGGAGATIVYATVGQTFSTASGVVSYIFNPSGGASTGVTVSAEAFTIPQPNPAQPPNNPTYFIAAGTDGSAFVLADSSSGTPAALSSGALIDPAATDWGTAGKLVDNHGSGVWSPTGGGAYLGFYYADVDNNTYAGWADIATSVTDSASFTVIDYAYDDAPNTTIEAGEGRPAAAQVPEPASIALLAMGAAGIAAVRRRRAHARSIPSRHRGAP